MKYRNLCLGVVLAVAMTACGKDEKKNQDDHQGVTPLNQSSAALNDVRVNLTWEKQPVSNKKGVNFATLTVDGQSDVTVADVDPQMPQHGHGTVREHQKIEKISDNPATFKISGLFFTMPGSWVIYIKLVSQGQEFMRSFDVEVVK